MSPKLRTHLCPLRDWVCSLPRMFLVLHLTKNQVLLQMQGQVSCQCRSISQLPQPNLTTSGPLLSKHLYHTTLRSLLVVMGACLSSNSTRRPPRKEATLHMLLGPLGPPHHHSVSPMELSPSTLSEWNVWAAWFCWWMWKVEHFAQWTRYLSRKKVPPSR